MQRWALRLSTVLVWVVWLWAFATVPPGARIGLIVIAIWYVYDWLTDLR